MHYVLSKRFEKDFSKLPKKIKNKAIIQLEIFVENPLDSRLNNHTLAGKWQGCQSINITGDLRAIYALVGEDVAQFVSLGSHSDLYS